MPEEACASRTTETAQTSVSEDHDILVVRSIHKLSAALKHCASKFHQDPHQAKQSPSNGSFKLIPESISKLFRWLVAAVKHIGSNLKNACYRQTSTGTLPDNSEPNSPSIVEQLVASEAQHFTTNPAIKEAPAVSSSSAPPGNGSDAVVEQPVIPEIQHSSTEPADEASPYTSSSSASPENGSDVVVEQPMPATSAENNDRLTKIDEPIPSPVLTSSDEASPKVETHQSPEVELPSEVRQVSPFSSDRFTFEAPISLDTNASSMSSLSVEAEQPAIKSAPYSIEASPKVETHQSPKVELPIEIEHTAFTPSRPSSVESSPESETQGSPSVESPSEARYSRRRVLTPRSLADKIPDNTLQTLLASKHRSAASDATSNSSETPAGSSNNTTLATVSPVSSVLSDEPTFENGPMGQAFSSIERQMLDLQEEIRACKGKETYGKVNSRDSTQFNLFDKLESPDSRRARISQGIAAYKKRVDLEKRLEELEETMKALLKLQLRASEGGLKEKIEDLAVEAAKKEPVVVEEELVSRAGKRADARKRKNASKKAKAKAKREENAKKTSLFTK
ncbi:MAG: hypothetical protein Q9160_007203 [Pyrenula sp. 1 TL-2023]